MIGLNFKQQKLCFSFYRRSLYSAQAPTLCNRYAEKAETGYCAAELRNYINGIDNAREVVRSLRKPTLANLGKKYKLLKPKLDCLGI